MHDSFLTGLVIVLAAGVLQGSFMYPTKWMKGWEWENYWLIFAAVAYLVSPWALAILGIAASAGAVIPLLVQPPTPSRPRKSRSPGPLSR